jgi:hypothetical protein
MTECQEFFEQLDAECNSLRTATIRGDRLRQERKDESREARLKRLVDWESTTASRYSPGPVDSTEHLRMAILQGRDVAEGTPHRGMFQPLVDIGLSADRLTATTPDATKVRFQALANSKSKLLFGFLDLSVAHLRSVVCDREVPVEKPKKQQPVTNAAVPKVRAIAVYDTAISDNTAHAEAFLVVKHSNSKPYKSLETDLLERYRDHIQRY